MASRPVQVTVWGASGFTGRLVCEHLVQNYQVGAAAAAQQWRHECITTTALCGWHST
jgi:short subunit dehydrogenase-like uncharacterized protein